MKQGTVDEAAKEILTHQKITFLTGAGVSTPSGVPDYRSLTGIYHGMEQPEYLLSHQAMVNEPDKFYQFVKKGCTRKLKARNSSIFMEVCINVIVENVSKQ